MTGVTLFVVKKNTIWLNTVCSH